MNPLSYLVNALILNVITMVIMEIDIPVSMLNVLLPKLGAYKSQGCL